MNQEIEVKFLIRNFESLTRKIADLNAICTQARVHELNLRFDQANRHLSEKKQVLRLRQDFKTFLTFKGPGIVQDDVLHRQEIEVILSDFETGKKLLTALGYEVIMVYEKFRTNYFLNGLTLSVDEMPYGLFIELEGESSDQVREAAASMGMAWEHRINNSYSGLLRVFNQNTGHNFRDLTFENFSRLTVQAKDLGLSYAD